MPGTGDWMRRISRPCSILIAPLTGWPGGTLAAPVLSAGGVMFSAGVTVRLVALVALVVLRVVAGRVGGAGGARGGLGAARVIPFCIFGRPMALTMRFATTPR